MGIKETIALKYEEGRPGGFVHDLTLFSDASFWVQARPAGYYTRLPQTVKDNVIAWCRENLCNQWSIRYNELYIKNAEDAAIFALKWS